MLLSNPVTLRLEGSGADGSSLVSQLFSTSVSSSALLSPTGDLSSLGKGPHSGTNGFILRSLGLVIFCKFLWVFASRAARVLERASGFACFRVKAA